MAEQPVAQECADEEDDALDHEDRIIDRVMESIAPDELPCDIDPVGVAYGLWLRLTHILLICGFTGDELVSDVREEQLSEAEPDGSA